MRRHGLRRYVRAHLHRQLFLWFGATILGAGLTTFLVLNALNRFSDSPWRQPLDRAQTFLGPRFEAVWDAPAPRLALAQDLARAFDLQVELRDPEGALLEHVGSCRKSLLTVTVQRDGRALGQVLACGPVPHTPGRFFVPLITAGLVLWLVSGLLARRLGRPLRDLTRVAVDLGEGRLASRARLGRHPPGEVGQLALAMNDMAAKIEKQMADQLALLAMVSHELRTPLARMRVLSELGREGTTSVARVLDDMDFEIAAVDGLVGQLLASSRLDFAATNMQSLDGVEVLRHALERAGVAAELLHVETDAPAFVGDPTLVACALHNLLENARKHGRGVVAARLQRQMEGLRFVVEDAGPGFQGPAGRIFEAFYQGSPVHGRDPTSLGLGLNLVRRIAQAHRGTAFAHNRPEGGAAVGLLLPA